MATVSRSDLLLTETVFHELNQVHSIIRTRLRIKEMSVFDPHTLRLFSSVIFDV
jgi:hypothetical protein